MRTKAQIRTAVRQLLDDPIAALWHDAVLDDLIGQTYDELWGRILNNAPYYLTQLDTISTFTAPGYISLDTDLSQRFHRLQSLVRGERTYNLADPRTILVSENAVISGPQYSYAFYGNQLWMFPLETTGAVELRYSYKPAAFTGLTESTNITWPDGHESALIFEAAGRALFKGGDPTGLLKMAERAMDELITVVKKRQHFMSVMWTNDSGESFGST